MEPLHPQASLALGEEDCPLPIQSHQYHLRTIFVDWILATVPQCVSINTGCIFVLENYGAWYYWVSLLHFSWQFLANTFPISRPCTHSRACIPVHLKIPAIFFAFLTPCYFFCKVSKKTKEESWVHRHISSKIFLLLIFKNSFSCKSTDVFYKLSKFYRFFSLSSFLHK